MASTTVKIIIINVLVAVNIHISSQCPKEILADAKAAYKSGEIVDLTTPITLDKIKAKLQESGIFDWQDPNLTEREKKELNKLFEAVEIMTTARNRQPSNVQHIFSSLRLVERVVKKQLKERQISESLASKFNWEKISSRPSREFKPLYYIDKETNMRIFKDS